MPKFVFPLTFYLLILTGPALSQDKPQDLPRETLTVETETGAHEFSVQIARTDRQKRLGLMFVTSMPETEGMLFTYKYPEAASFWMRNTYIPLDIIFIYPDGTIANIAREATPMSLDAIISAGYVTGVLEINGGLADKLGIEVR